MFCQKVANIQHRILSAVLDTKIITTLYSYDFNPICMHHAAVHNVYAMYFAKFHVLLYTIRYPLYYSSRRIQQHARTQIAPSLAFTHQCADTKFEQLKEVWRNQPINPDSRARRAKNCFEWLKLDCMKKQIRFVIVSSYYFNAFMFIYFQVFYSIF